MRVFKRNINCEQGYQIVVATNDLIVIDQTIRGHRGNYSERGNPEWVGRRTRKIKGFWGMFRELKGDSKNGHIKDFLYSQNKGLKPGHINNPGMH